MAGGGALLLIFVIMLNTSLLLSRLAMVIMGTFYISAASSK